MECKLFVLLFVPMFVLSGCGIVIPYKRNVSKLDNLSVDMSVKDVENIIGKPDATRGATKLENGSTLVLKEYYLSPKRAVLENIIWGIPTLTLSWWIYAKSTTETYWLNFVDDKLEKWGRARDWQPDVTQDITVRQK